MKYRTLGRTGFQVSEIGLGGEYLEGKPLKQVCNTVDAAMDAGINLLDCFMSNPDIRSDLGTALKGKRDKMYIQGHFRSIWKNGQYGRTMDVKVVQAFFEDLLRRMQTDYIDLGMIHMIDNAQEYHSFKLSHPPGLEVLSPPPSQATYLGYHTQFALSRTFSSFSNFFQVLSASDLAGKNGQP